MKTKPIAISAVAVADLAAVIWASSGVSQTELSKGSLFPYLDETVIAKGQKIYKESCASCHGDDLKGEANWQTRKASGRLPAPPHDETGHTWHHRDELLLAITKFGLAKLTNNPDYETDMPVYEGVLEDDEIIAVLAYIKSTWPAEIQTRHDQMNSQSK